MLRILEILLGYFLKLYKFILSAAYAVTGCVFGGVLGLLLHRTFYGLLITSNWGISWRPPLVILLVIVLTALLTTFIAVIIPVKKTQRMSIVNVVNANQ
jgi:putative ABC transport system permease protein